MKEVAMMQRILSKMKWTKLNYEKAVKESNHLDALLAMERFKVLEELSLELLAFLEGETNEAQ